MATMNVSLPEPMKTWVETIVKKGQYANSSDYIRDLIRRDQNAHELDKMRYIGCAEVRSASLA